MALLNFELAAGRMAAYAPPCRKEQWIHRFGFMEKAGDRWWPFAGAVYVMQGIKRQHGMRLLTPAWQDRKARAKALAALTNKTTHQTKEHAEP